MRMRRFTCFTGVLATLLTAAPAGPEWHGWSDAIFAQAKRENRFVLLDLEAVWCHWCHVMDETTYRDPAVNALLKARYLTVRVDQDARPDLSNRYEDYGWPATIVFDGNGKEIVKRSGYLPPKQMESMLRAIIADPTPGPSVQPEVKPDFSHGPHLTAGQKVALTADFFKSYDSAKGAWGFSQKFLDGQAEEYAMSLAAAGDVRAKQMARQTLYAQLRLVDPAWGGVYQYSTGGDWNEPHFEKIMLVQAVNLRAFALGYAMWREPAFLRAAQSVRTYLKTFLTSPEGAFYTSQDADLVAGEHSAGYFALGDAARRKLGVPRVDRNIYSRENGWAISGLCALYGATGDAAVLQDAVRAAAWIVAHRALPNGGFRHGETDAAGPYLGETLSMGRAFLDLYAVTGDREWLGRAETSARFIAANFGAAGGTGFVTTRTPTDHAWTPRPERDENIALVRFSNLLRQYTGNEFFGRMAERAMGYVAAPQVAQGFPTAGPLEAERELSSEPLHVTVVGRRDDVAAKALFMAALALPANYKMTEFVDGREGASTSRIAYPASDRAAAYVCSGTRCSRPIFAVDIMRERVEKFSAQFASEHLTKR